MALEDAIERVLWTRDQISAGVSQMAARISSDLAVTASDAPLVVVGVATGAFVFFADLVRGIQLPLAVDFVRAASYGRQTESTGRVTLSCDVNIDVRGKHVLLVEDIVDTGNTLSYLTRHFKSKGACSVSVCALLDKPSRRKFHFELVGEGKFYSVFECPDNFVVGYGMDFAELYRNLPLIGILKPEIYQGSA